MTSIAGKEPSAWEAKFPLIRELVAYQETACGSTPESGLATPH